MHASSIQPLCYTEYHINVSPMQRNPGDLSTKTEEIILPKLPRDFTPLIHIDCIRQMLMSKVAYASRMHHRLEYPIGRSFSASKPGSRTQSMVVNSDLFCQLNPFPTNGVRVEPTSQSAQVYPDAQAPFCLSSFVSKYYVITFAFWSSATSEETFHLLSISCLQSP